MSSEQLDAIRAGYATQGASVQVGAAVSGALTAPTAHPDVQVTLPMSVMNRHGLVAGATGTGKTKTLQLLAEQLSTGGVPVFLADMKGDLSGLAAPGEAGERVSSRAADVGQEWEPAGFPVEFFSLGGVGSGVPIRATITDFGPLLLARVLGLNATQTSSLHLVFHYADKRGLPLLDLKDLRAVVAHLVSEEGKADLKELGGLSSATAGVILRSLVTFSDAGADVFFGEPEFRPEDLLRTTDDGRGVISCLELPAVQERPAVFSTFLMWLLAELFQDLPEVGDLDAPKLVFFFDEAHLLFKGASKEFVEQIEQTVRLIRSKGVGIFFVTQSARDVPAGVLGQLGNRVQHALRAFTPEDEKALRATVRTFPKSDYDLAALLASLGIGEAAVTVLSERGVPTPVAWTRMRCPQSRMAPLTEAEMAAIIEASPLRATYEEAIDRESAYEMLASRLDQEQGEEAVSPPARDLETSPSTSSPPAPSPSSRSQEEGPGPQRIPVEGDERPRSEPSRRQSREREEPNVVEQALENPMVRSMLRSAGTVLGREITRSVFGTARRRRR